MRVVGNVKTNLKYLDIIINIIIDIISGIKKYTWNCGQFNGLKEGSLCIMFNAPKEISEGKAS